MEYEQQKPKKQQIFNYRFSQPKPGDKVLLLRDISHALSNSDQYPVPLDEVYGRSTLEGKIVAETIDAVCAAIEACPRYEIKNDAE